MLTTTKSKTQKEMSNLERVMSDNPGVFKRISDIEVPDILFHPIKTNTLEFDRAFSEIGGITPGSVYLITGTPGAGKTTIMVTLGSRLQTTKPIVFLSYEMSDFQLKLTAKKISGLGKFIIVTKEFHKDKQGFEDFLQTLEDLDPGMIIVDSLQKMAGVMPGSFNQNQIWLTEKFTKLAKKSFIPVCMIGHVGKDGAYKGPSTLLHEVDGQMHIFIDKESGERMFQFGKNRFGGVFDPYIFRITGDGVFIGQEFWQNSDNDIASMAIESVKNLRAAAKNQSHLPFKAFQQTSKVIVKYLENFHQEELAKNSNVKNGIKLTYTGSGAWCSQSKAQLNFGPKFFKVCNDSTFRNIGYKKEKKYMEKYISDKVDMAIWVIVHEFQHLFFGNSKHTNAFFGKIEKTWKMHSEVFSVK